MNILYFPQDMVNKAVNEYVVDLNESDGDYTGRQNFATLIEK